jgi:uncharacterized protein
MNTMLKNEVEFTSRQREALPEPAPTPQKERHIAVDVLRGAALLGILVANIEDFGLPTFGYMIPLGTPIPSFEGPNAWLNLTVLTLKWVFVHAKMRALFSMLFGAGLVMMAERAERRGNSAVFADIYARRNLWLLGFGFLHAVFIWEGDILFDYGLAGLFLYPFRKLKPKTLLVTGSLISLLLGTAGLNRLEHVTADITLKQEVGTIHARQQAAQALSAEQQHKLKEWDKRVARHAVNKENTDGAIAAGTRPYLETLQDKPDFFVGPGSGWRYYFGLTDALGMMLAGMGLYKLGFLTGQRSRAAYARTAALGFLIGVPLCLIGLWKSYLSGFDFVTVDQWLILPLYVEREANTLAIAAMIILAVKCGWFVPLQRALAAVGKTALSNYLLTSVICQFVFIWGPWPLYGKLEYYQLNFVVCGVWTFNLVASMLWLRTYQFGPFEWVWRSLTYIKAQPMRKA